MVDGGWCGGVEPENVCGAWFVVCGVGVDARFVRSLPFPSLDLLQGCVCRRDSRTLFPGHAFSKVGDT